MNGAQDFFWYELATTDAEGARRFYEAVVGWEVQDLPGPHQGYSLFNADGLGVAGLMTIAPEDCPTGTAEAGWKGYVSVPDADAAASRIEGAGGRILRAPADIPEVGRFAAVADPGGAPFLLMTPQPRDDVPPRPPRMTPGHVGWHELYAADGDRAFAFYAEQFGWQETSVMDMGPMGSYRLWSADGGEAVGGMMTAPGHVPEPRWQFYIVVDSVASAAGRIQAAGGAVTQGPVEVPDGSWIVLATDPQGAPFGLVSRGR